MAAIQAKILYSLRDSFEKCILIKADTQRHEVVQQSKKNGKEKKLTSFLGIFDCCCFIFVSLKKAK